MAEAILEDGLCWLGKGCPPAWPYASIPQTTVDRVVKLTTLEKPETPPTGPHAPWLRQSGSAKPACGASGGKRPEATPGTNLQDQQGSAVRGKTGSHRGSVPEPAGACVGACCDEKSQIQALDRTQPGLPLKKGRGQTMTHDYKRNGTATLFAALNTLDGSVISICQERHRHQEWLKFLRLLDDATPDDKQLHLIVDNYATHKHPKVQRWLARHPRFHVHFTPTGASWLNMVERFFRDLTEHRLRRGVFRDVEELITAIDEYVDRHNESPKPFIWTAKASDILEKVKRARAALNNVQSV